MDSKLQAAFDEWEASFDALYRYLEDATTPTPASTPAITTDGVVGPVPASSSMTKLVTAAVVATDISSSTAKAPEVLHDASSDCIEMVHTTCSTERSTQVVAIASVDEIHDATTTVQQLRSVQSIPCIGTNTTCTWDPGVPLSGLCAHLQAEKIHKWMVSLVELQHWPFWEASYLVPIVVRTISDKGREIMKLHRVTGEGALILPANYSNVELRPLPWPSFSCKFQAVQVRSALFKFVPEHVSEVASSFSLQKSWSASDIYKTQAHWKFYEHQVLEHADVSFFPRPDKMPETIRITSMSVQWTFLNQEEKFQRTDCFTRDCGFEQCGDPCVLLACLMVQPIGSVHKRGVQTNAVKSKEFKGNICLCLSINLVSLTSSILNMLEQFTAYRNSCAVSAFGYCGHWRSFIKFERLRDSKTNEDMCGHMWFEPLFGAFCRNWDASDEQWNSEGRHKQHVDFLVLLAHLKVDHIHSLQFWCSTQWCPPIAQLLNEPPVLECTSPVTSDFLQRVSSCCYFSLATCAICVHNQPPVTFSPSAGALINSLSQQLHHSFGVETIFKLLMQILQQPCCSMFTPAYHKLDNCNSRLGEHHLSFREPDAYHFNRGCSDLIYYSAAYHGDCNKAYLDKWQDREQCFFDGFMARMDTHLRSMRDITGCVTGPVMASSDVNEFVLASAGPAEPPAPVPTTENSPVVAATVLIDTISVAPANCSTESPSHDANVSTPASTPATALTSPTATVDVIPVLAAAAAGDGTLDGKPIKGAASMAERSLAVAGAVPSDTTVVVHAFCSADCATQVVTAPSTTPATMPPPLLWASGSSSSHASSNPRPIPWSSFVVLPGDVHLTEPRPTLQGTSGEFSVVVAVMHHFLDSQFWVSPLPICLQYELDREENVNSVQHNDREEQFNSLGVRLNVSDFFFKKPCAESKEAIMSGLISRGATVFKLWQIPWFSFLFLELTSEEPYDLALFQWEMKLWGVKRLFHEKGDDRFITFNLKIAEIFLCLSTSVDDTMFPTEELCQFVSSGFAKAKVLRNKDLLETHLSPLITYIPGLISEATDDSKGYLLEAFTDAFRDSNVDCKLILPYLDAVGEMLFPDKSRISFTAKDLGILEYHSTWINELPGILLQSVDKAPSVTKVVLELLVRSGQYLTTLECANLRSIAQLFGTKSSSGMLQLGPFIYLPHDCQELAIACLYYFSNLLPDIIEPLACCCLSDKLEPLILFSIVDVLQSTYKAGNLQITEQLSFLSLLMARFDVNLGMSCTPEDARKISNWNTITALNHLILTSFSKMGDGSLVLELIWNNLSNEIARKPSLHNMNGLFRIIVTLDAATNKLMNEDVIMLIVGYLVDAALDMSKPIEVGFQYDTTRLFQYFIKPCRIMFEQNDTVLCCTLKMLKYFASGDDRMFSSVQLLLFKLLPRRPYLELPIGIAFISQILIDYAYYLEQAYYFDTICSDIISYREDYDGDSSKTKEVHMPWDPGKSSFKHTTPKIRLGDKPSFKEGGMLGPSPCARQIGPVPWARNKGLGPAHSHLQIVTYKYPTRSNEEVIQVGSGKGTAASLSHLGSDSPFPFLLVHHVSRLTTKSL